MKHTLSLLTALLLAPLAALPAAEFADGGSPATLRAAIRDLMNECGARYPSGGGFLGRLDVVEKQMATGAESGRAAFAQLQREALVANPLVSCAPILFVTREQYQSDHHNTETIFHTGEPNCVKYRPGGALKILDPATGRTSVGRYQALREREQTRRQALADGRKIYDAEVKK